MSQLNKLPVFETPLTFKNTIMKDWYFFWSGLWQRIPPEAEIGVTVGASPFLFTAPRGGFIIVQGGTVSAIAFSRDGTNFYNTGQTQGMITIGSKDQVRITYSVLPTITFVPT